MTGVEEPVALRAQWTSSGFFELLGVRAALGRTPRPEEERPGAPRVVLLGPSTEVRGGKPAAVAAVAGQGPVMLVDAKALQDLSKSAMDLRDKALLPAFELNDVKRARIMAAGKPLVVERSGTTDWKVVEPSRTSAKEDKVSNLIL